MKTVIALLLSFSLPLLVFSQVGINNTNPNAMLEITSSNVALPANTDGILIPQVDEFPAINPTVNQDGMMVFATGSGVPAKGFYYWDQGTVAWVAVGGSGDTQNTLDEAYDEGGAGVGRTIITDNGAVDIQGNDGLRVEGAISAAANIVHDGDTDTFLNFTPDRIQLDAGGTNFMNIVNSSNEINFNENGASIDLRVESDNEAYMLFVDGSTDRLGINRNNPFATLHVAGNMDGSGTAVQIDAGDTQDGVNISLSGTSSTAADNSDGIFIGNYTNFTGAGARPSGMTISMNGSSTETSSSIRALDISYNGPSNYLGSVYGSYMLDLSAADNTFYGYFVSTGSTGSNNSYGSYNALAATGTADIYGTYNTLSGAGAGNKYGTYNFIQNVAGGTHYGTYSDVQSITGYAGYFIGRTSLGAGTSNRYLMPAVDGTAGQVMTTNGAGVVGFITPTTGVEKIDDLTDGKSDSDGTNDGSSVFLGVNAGAADNSSNNQNVGVGFQAIEDNVSGQLNTAVGYASLQNMISGQANVALGMNALTGLSSGSSNTAVGMYAGRSVSNSSGNIFLGYYSGTGSTGDNKLYIENSGANADNALIYGEFDNDILRTNAEFQIGNPTGTGYALPLVDGTVGQVMTTNGAGNVGFATVTGDGDTQNTLNEAYDEGGAGAGRIINATDGALEVSGDDGFQVTGTVGSGNVISLTGAGTRMFFNPRKGAFRSGRVNGTQWDDANIGNHSFAIGENTTASGMWDVAMGYQSTASGGASTAMGSNTVASGLISVAIGDQNTASGDRSLALGAGNLASGNVSTSMGSISEATGQYSVAIGYNNVASGNNAFALGTETTALSFSETVVGIFNTSYTPNNTVAMNASDRLFVVGNGISGGSRSNALTIYKNGTMNINDAYDLPTADGTSGQVLTTDGAGQISFSTPTSGDADWYEVGTTNPPSAITDNIFTQGKVGIGNASANYTLDVDYTGTDLRAADVNYIYTGSNTPATGLRVRTEGTGLAGSVFGGYFEVAGSSNSSSTTGIYVLNSAPSLNNSGASIAVVGAGSYNRGLYSYAIGATLNLAADFGDPAQPGSGNVRVNDELEILGNFQLVDGTENTDYVLRSDSFGNASWVDPAVIGDGTGTDDQLIDTFGIMSDNLGISIEDDGQPVQTVDLSNLSFNVSNFALARMRMPNSVQSFAANTGQYINFGIADFDINSNFNTTTDRFEVTEAGYYRIDASFRTLGPSTATDLYFIQIRVNGIAVKSDSANHSGSGNIYRYVSTVEALSPGDYVEILAFGQSAFDINFSTEFTSFSVERIR